jgi:hypothetical protein
LYIWTDWNLIREPLRTSGLKAGANIAVGEKSSQKKKPEPLEDETKRSLRKKKRRYICRLFGTNRFKEI